MVWQKGVYKLDDTDVLTLFIGICYLMNFDYVKIDSDKKVTIN